MIATAMFVLFAWGFVEIADKLAEKNSLDFDERIIHMLRNSGYFSSVSKPTWLQSAVRDITSLGGFTVLAIVVVISGGCFVLKQNYASAVHLSAVLALGSLLSNFLKVAFSRPRPDIEHTVYVVSYGFPSGHAMLSASVYLTLGMILAEMQARRRIKIYLLTISVILTLLVGISRVCLGVHYPTDIMAGWLSGTVWALVCFMIAQRFRKNA